MTSGNEELENAVWDNLWSLEALVQSAESDAAKMIFAECAIKYVDYIVRCLGHTEESFGFVTLLHLTEIGAPLISRVVWDYIWQLAEHSDDRRKGYLSISIFEPIIEMFEHPDAKWKSEPHWSQIYEVFSKRYTDLQWAIDDQYDDDSDSNRLENFQRFEAECSARGLPIPYER